MIYKDGVQNILTKKQVISLYEQINSVKGLSQDRFTLRLVKPASNLNVFDVMFDNNPNYHFEFYWKDSNDVNKIEARFNPPINSQNTVTSLSFTEMISQFKNWVEEIKNEEDENFLYQKITTQSNLDQDGKIIVENNPFNQIEVDKLKSKIDSIEETIFHTQGLTLQAVEELKQMLHEVLYKAGKTNTTKSDLEETIIGKVMIKIKDHAGDEIFKNVALNTMKELLASFKGYDTKLLPYFFQNLIS